MSNRKRRPDGKKNRERKSERKAPAARFLPPPAFGFERKNERRIVGESPSFKDFVKNVFGKLFPEVFAELREQREEGFARPFNAHGTATIDGGAIFNFSVQGANPGEPEFDALRAQAEREGAEIHQTERLMLEDALKARAERIAELAEEEIDEQLSEWVYSAFYVGCFLFVSDLQMILNVRLEGFPPDCLAQYRPSDPALS